MLGYGLGRLMAVVEQLARILSISRGHQSAEPGGERRKVETPMISRKRLACEAPASPEAMVRRADLGLRQWSDGSLGRCRRSKKRCSRAALYVRYSYMVVMIPLKVIVGGGHLEVGAIQCVIVGNGNGQRSEANRDASHLTYEFPGTS